MPVSSARWLGLFISCDMTEQASSDIWKNRKAEIWLSCADGSGMKDLVGRLLADLGLFVNRRSIINARMPKGG